MKKKSTITDTMVDGLRKHAKVKLKEKRNDLEYLNNYSVPMILTQVGATYNGIQNPEEILLLEDNSQKEKNNNTNEPKVIVLQYPMYEQPEREYDFREIPPIIIS